MSSNDRPDVDGDVIEFAEWEIKYFQRPGIETSKRMMSEIATLKARLAKAYSDHATVVESYNKACRDNERMEKALEEIAQFEYEQTPGGYTYPERVSRRALSSEGKG